MYINEEAIQVLLWHLGNSLDRCVEESIKPPADSDVLLHQLTQGTEDSL